MLALVTLALAATAASAANTTTTLKPILREGCNKADPANLVPAKNITLDYGAGSDKSLVKVTLAMKYPSVVLEEVAAVSGVSCADSGVTVTFNDTAAFQQTSRDWAALDDFVMVTNHLGGCDAEMERGFFLVDSVSFDPATLQVVANAFKSDVANTATSTEIVFSNVPVQNNDAKRDIKWDADGVHIANKLALPADTTLFTYDPYVAITADEASLSSSMTFSGKLRYTVVPPKVEELSLDIDTTFDATLGLTVDVKAPYSGNFTYDPEDLGYNFVDIPGIIKLGPALGFAIGVELDATAAAVVTTDLGLSFPDAKLHLDLLNAASTAATGWEPVWTANANISEKAAIGVNPYVELGVELVFNILGGAVDLSTGITSHSKLDNDFLLSASQGVGTDGNGIGQDNTACQEGFAIKSNFFFSVVGFATKWWSQELYSVEVPVADECYTWL